MTDFVRATRVDDWSISFRWMFHNYANNEAYLVCSSANKVDICLNFGNDRSSQILPMAEHPEFNILVAEDDSGYRRLLTLAFERAGVVVGLHFVSDGLEAIRYFQGAGAFYDRVRFPFPDLVLLDINMPHLNGIGVLQWLRQQEWIGPVPIIMLSNSEAQGDVDLAHKFAANACLLKPTGMDQMESMVMAIECFWVRLHRYPSCCGRQEAADLRRI